MTETDTIATAAAATPATEEATDLAALAELTAQRSAVYRLLAASTAWKWTRSSWPS